MADDAARLAGAGLLGAGSLYSVGKALDSDRANAILVRYLTQLRRRRGAHDYRIPVYSAAGHRLANGSGEAIMASNISRLLNRHGVGSYFVNAMEQPETGLWGKMNAIDHTKLDRLASLPGVEYGETGSALDLLTKRLKAAGFSERQALDILKSGKFDGYTPGELLDTFKVIGNKGIANVVSGKESLMPNTRFLSRLDRGKLDNVMTGEVGLAYNGVNETTGPRPRDVQGYTRKRVEPVNTALDSNPFLNRAGRTRNLAFDTQFQANYESPTDKLIPGSKVSDPGVFRRSPLARRLAYGWSGLEGIGKRHFGGGIGAFGQRKQMFDIISRIAAEQGIDPKTISPKTKFMLISTGSAGPNAAEKLRLAGKAFAGDPNARILMQYGKEPTGTGFDIFSPNGVKEEIARLNAARPGFVIGTPRIDPADYKKLIGTVDLHGMYGGSSSITEAMSNTNPGVMLHDSRMNRKNNNYASANRGYRSVDTTATGIRPLVERGAPLDTNIGRGYTLGQAMADTGVTRGTDFGKLEADAVKGLQDAMYRSPSRFDRKNVAAANAVIRQQRLRDLDFVNTVRRDVSRAINANDTKVYTAMKPGVGKFYRGLSRVLFKTPVGRRIGIPLALASALGIGAGAYNLSK